MKLKCLPQILLLAACSTCFAAPVTFRDRLGHFEDDATVCRKFSDTKICDEVDHRVKGVAGFQKKELDNAEDEGEPIVIKYDEGETLRILEIANTELIADWVVDLYPIDDHHLFVVCFGTPHVDELKETAGHDVPLEDQIPVTYSFLLRDGQIEKQYSKQADRQPAIPEWVVSDAISSFKNYGSP